MVASNLEAEKAILSSIMLDDNNLLQVDEKLKPDHFFNKSHQIIYQAMLDLSNKKLQIDTIMLREHLNNKNLLNDVGGLSYILEIQEDMPPSGMIVQYADIVISKYMIREFLIITSSAFTEGRKSDESFKELLDTTQQRLLDLSQRQISKGYVKIGTLINKVLESLRSNEDESGVVGVATGFEGFDSRTAGLKKGNLIVLAARPSMGKTALSLNIASNAALNNKKVGFFSIEMSSEELTLRMLSSFSGINSQNINRCFLNPHETIPFMQAAASLYEVNVFIEDSSSITMNSIRSISRKLKIKEGIDLIIIDYLQLITAEGRFDNKNHEISYISRSLKSLARELDIPILVLSQLSRGVENRADRRPMLSDLRDSGAIEQDADVVFFIYRDVIYNPDTEHPDQAEIIISKQRNGPTGSFHVRYLREITKFVDW